MGGFNLYRYAPNSISWIDPFGLCNGNGTNPNSDINSRINNIKAAMSADELSRTTYSVARVRLADGTEALWVSSAGKRGYVRPDIRRAAGTDIVITNKSTLGNAQNRLNDAEQTILREARAQGAEILEIGATRPMCHACQGVFAEAGKIEIVVTPLKP